MKRSFKKAAAAVCSAAMALFMTGCMHIGIDITVNPDGTANAVGRYAVQKDYYSDEMFEGTEHEIQTFTIDGEELTVDCLMCAVCNGRTYGGGFYAAPEAQPDDGWLDVFIIRRVSRLTIARLLGMYKSGRHFRNGELTEQAKPYFIYRRAKQVTLRAVDGRGPIVATADGECVPTEQVAVQLRPLAGRILLPKPAFERFAAQRQAESANSISL